VLDLLSGGQMLMHNARLAHLGLLEGKVISELLLMVAYKITTRDLSRVGEDKCKTDTGQTKAPKTPFATHMSQDVVHDGQKLLVQVPHF